VTLANWQKFSKVRSLLDLLRRIIPELSFENSHTLYFSHTLTCENIMYENTMYENTMYENTMYENTMYDLLRKITRELSFESTIYESFDTLKIQCMTATKRPFSSMLCFLPATRNSQKS